MDSGGSIYIKETRYQFRLKFFCLPESQSWGVFASPPLSMPYPVDPVCSPTVDSLLRTEEASSAPALSLSPSWTCPDALSFPGSLQLCVPFLGPPGRPMQEAAEVLWSETLNDWVRPSPTVNLETSQMARRRRAMSQLVLFRTPADLPPHISSACPSLPTRRGCFPLDTVSVSLPCSVTTVRVQHLYYLLIPHAWGHRNLLKGLLPGLMKTWPII